MFMRAGWRAAAANSLADNFRYRESLFPKIIKSFEAEAVKHRFDILLCATNYDPGRTQMAVQKMIENRVRGVAVMTVSVDPAIARELKKSRIPVVSLELGWWRTTSATFT